MGLLSNKPRQGEDVMTALRILEPGIFASIQDLGRPGLRRYGIPISGGMDRYSLRVANLLVGNHENSACLEVTLGGTTLEATEDTVVATTGADLSPKLNEGDMPQWEAVRVRRGDRIRFITPRKGCRSYLSIIGGFETPICLGSRSSYSKSKLGQVESRILIRGLELASSEYSGSIEEIVGRRVERSLIPIILERPTVNIVLAREDQDLFPDESFDLLTRSVYAVSTESDRVGCRLIGQKLSHLRAPEILSEPTPLGSVQVPGDGQPIVLMADAPTTGGYPKIGYVATSDLPTIAQLKAGDSVTFREATVETAIERLLEQEKRVKEIRERFQAPRAAAESRDAVTILASLMAMIEKKPVTISFEGGYEIRVTPKTDEKRLSEQKRKGRAIEAPLTGTVTKIHVEKGERVEIDQLVASVEALKMQVEVRSPHAGTVNEIHVTTRQNIKQGTVMMMIGE